MGRQRFKLTLERVKGHLRSLMTEEVLTEFVVAAEQYLPQFLEAMPTEGRPQLVCAGSSKKPGSCKHGPAKQPLLLPPAGSKWDAPYPAIIGMELDHLHPLVDTLSEWIDQRTEANSNFDSPWDHGLQDPQRTLRQLFSFQPSQVWQEGRLRLQGGLSWRCQKCHRGTTSAGSLTSKIDEAMRLQKRTFGDPGRESCQSPEIGPMSQPAA